MVYIEVIYLILYSIICFLVVKNIYKIKVDDIYNDYVSKLEELDSEFIRLRNRIESNFDETKKNISKQNKQYLSQMNDDISGKIKELSNNVKNKRII